MLTFSYRSNASGEYARLYVMGNGTASVSIIGGGSKWFPCSQDAARWLRGKGFSQV